MRFTPLVMQHAELMQRDPLRQCFSSASSESEHDMRVLHTLMHRASELAVFYPSPLSERLLDMVEAWEQKHFPAETPLISVRFWRQLWQADESARSFYEDWRGDSAKDFELLLSLPGI